MGNTSIKGHEDIDLSQLEFQGSIQSNMLRMLSDDVFKKYRVIDVIGHGSMGYIAKAKVRTEKVGGSAVRDKKGFLKKKKVDGIHELRASEVRYALKSIQVDRVSDSLLKELRNEIDILKVMDHPNIIRAYEYFENKRQFYLVLELCEGGDLYAKGPYTEMKARRFRFSDVNPPDSHLNSMHDHGVVHRDLKFENVMFEHKGDDSPIKVIDFGLSRKFGYGERDIMNEGVGSKSEVWRLRSFSSILFLTTAFRLLAIYTMAPQVLQGVYTAQADLWSCGVVIYMLLSSHRPFQEKNRRIMIDKIMRADYEIGGKHWEGISDEAIDLVKNLIELDPQKRLNSTTVLGHVWLSEEFEPLDSRPERDSSLDKRIVSSMVAYGNSSKLKKIAMNIIAHRSTSKEIVGLKEFFNEYDTSNDGVIELHEFKAAMQKANYSEEAIEAMFRGIDLNNNGLVQYTEFLASAIEGQSKIEEERIAEAFDQLDADSSGKISKVELLSFLGKDAHVEEIDEILTEWDTDKDGMISFDEFKAMFRKNSSTRKQQLFGAGDDVDEGENLVGLDAKIPGGKYDR
eukprot:scaffold9153_cov121-Cylindrotheca_fusiformis.AAC.6